MLKRKSSLLHIERWRDHTGKMRFYFRRDRRKGSPRSSDEFKASYARALHGELEDSRPKIERPGNGTMAALYPTCRTPPFAICATPRRAT